MTEADHSIVAKRLSLLEDEMQNIQKVSKEQWEVIAKATELISKMAPHVKSTHQEDKRVAERDITIASLKANVAELTELQRQDRKMIEDLTQTVFLLIKKIGIQQLVANPSDDIFDPKSRSSPQLSKCNDSKQSEIKRNS